MKDAMVRGSWLALHNYNPQVRSRVHLLWLHLLCAPSVHATLSRRSAYIFDFQLEADEV